MRSHGVAGSARGLGLSDHVCWTFGSDWEHRDFRTAAVEFADEGLELGQRLLYIVDDDGAGALADLAALGDLRHLRRTGRLLVQHRTQVEGAEGPVRDPHGRLLADTTVVVQAVAEGFRGLRVVSDSTTTVAQPAARGEHLAVELSIDRYMADGLPCTALCGYDRRVIGDDAAAALACVHPLRHDRAATFSLYAGTDRMFLEGEIDVVQAPWFAQALAALPDDDPLVLDACELRFMDAAAVTALARFAAERQGAGQTIVVEGARPVIRRVWDRLGYSGIETVWRP